jgi:hypothetical protein
MLLEVSCKGEQHRCLQGRGHDLAHFDIALEHDPVDRRADAGLGEVGFIDLQVCLRNPDIGFSALEGRLGPVIGGLSP